MGDVDRGAVFDEVEEFWRQIFMHANAAMGAGTVLHPAGMESIVCLELTPVGHGGAFEAPAGGLVAQVALTHLIAVVGEAVAVGPVFVYFPEYAKMPFGSWC